MTDHVLVKSIGGTIAGVVVGTLAGWTSHSLTFDGELRAVTAAVQRIEIRLDNMAKGSK